MSVTLCGIVAQHDGDAYRAVYTVRFGDFVYVLHAFQKKSRKTGKPDIELARRRYKQIEDES